MKTPEEMAEEYAEVMSFDVWGHQRGFLAGYKAAQQWISVKDRLPSDGDLVVVVCKGEASPSIAFALFEFWDKWDVTHWMPLPEAPKEDK